MAKRESPAAAEPESVVRLRVVSDERYVIGIPAEVGHEFEVEPAAASSLLETGLYEVVSADGAAGGNE